ncbi:hypothetical protein LD125_00412 [Mesoplasma sp. JKS002658]|uniref:lipoprotein n=1 Tax=Mesoplasma whartonense TaxID=2878854 RepID=UPI002022B6DA|nr:MULTISPECIES: lipoprotein [unclassified Mesoplasma]MCL8211470.1 hypothetical protein [Mesoplasma sp. JKS002664]MCL8212322.1 hypothetical protein [Mesoplasma sp. JKS002662]MCL8214149.1 hypothetical protein [Mesoplasma sp. JKS002658]MCL8214807.1 hypothetical protein [Mesoplasma sp. JKS002663]MCL8215468.1 hypothetical protein [Mesoplasma sp. JKS002659]
MRKILTILAAVGLTTTATTNIMACTLSPSLPVVTPDPDSETPAWVLQKIQDSDDFKNSSTIDFTFKSTNKRGLSWTKFLAYIKTIKANLNIDTIPATTRGTMVHHFAHDWFSDHSLTPQQVMINNGVVDADKPDVEGYLNSMDGWLHRGDANSQWFGSEVKAGVAALNMAGLFDALLYENGKFIIADFKTDSDKNIQDKFLPYQLSFYAKILNTILGDDVFVQGRLIQIKADGGKYVDYNFDLTTLNSQLDTWLDQYNSTH